MSLIAFPTSARVRSLTDARLRTLLAAQVALKLALDSAYSDLQAGARYVNTSLRLSEDGCGVVERVSAPCRSTSFLS